MGSSQIRSNRTHTHTLTAWKGVPGVPLTDNQAAKTTNNPAEMMLKLDNAPSGCHTIRKIRGQIKV